MNIAIPPIGIGLIIIIVSNCLIGFGKSDVMKKSYITLSSILSVLGILGIIMIRPQFISRLYKSAASRDYDLGFVTWAITKFDAFAATSIIVTCLIIICLLCFLLVNKRKKSGFIWNNVTIYVIFFKIIIFFAGVLYSFKTINKLFDIGAYIGALSIFQILALYIPLIAKRIIMLKD